MQNSQIAVVVHTCDRYQLLYKGFEYFFKKHWNIDAIQANYYFATEEVDANVVGFKNIKTGKGEWSNRLVNVIDQLEETYLLYFQEDMWLGKEVSPSFFNELFKLTTHYKWKQVKLHSSEVYVTHATNNFIEGFNIATVDNKKSNFLMSHQVTLWDKNFLRNQLPLNEHPWRNERKGSKRLKALNELIVHIDYFGENGKPPINDNKVGALPSFYKTISVNATLSDNALTYIEELQKVDEYFDYANLLMNNYQKGITHDGKPKPLKKDAFKRFKDWVRRKS